MMRMAILFLVAGLMFMGCGGGSRSSNVPMTKETEDAAVGGIIWSYPSRWMKSPPRMMRAATYTLPAVEGTAEEGECAVFFFGAGQGGDVDLNIERWVAQFENGVTTERKDRKVGEIAVTTVAVEGAFLSPSGPMMQSQGRKENYKLLGAVISAPGGTVFFKLTAPKGVADGAAMEFDAMVESVVAVP